MQKSKQNDLAEKEKLAILAKFLKNTPFEKWSNDNLIHSAEQCGFNKGYLFLLFPKGIEDLTEFFHQLNNQKLTSKFLETGKNISSTTEKIIYLIELKLEIYHQHRKAIPFLMRYNLKPKNFCKTQKFLWQTCNQIWYLAGDRSTNYNHYSKRMLLEYVYSSTIMYWISDDSEDYVETKKFLRKKIQEILKLGKIKNSISKFWKNATLKDE
jgi:ubiquinone biosynthesis protein COQ9